MYSSDILEVKNHFDDLKSRGLVSEWELPYENLLTRLNAAIFFFTPSQTHKVHLDQIVNEFDRYENFGYRLNTENKLSKLQFRVTFNADEKRKENEEAVAAHYHQRGY